MVRADVAIDPVSWTLVPGTKTALIRLDQFSAGAADDLKAVLGEVRTAGADRLILDLRDNPGGYVNEADAVASQFLKSGLVFIERGADGKETKHEVQPGGLATDLPLVVLVDAGTASSSEIVTGALQDAGRAQIVGVKTYGTGTVLGEFPLSDNSALRVGTVEWLTPMGRRIWHEGITPDVVVERASDIAARRARRGRQDDRDAGRRPDRPAARSRAVARHGDDDAGQLTGQPASRLQRQVISATSGRPGSTIAGVAVERVGRRRLGLHAHRVPGLGVDHPVGAVGLDRELEEARPAQQRADDACR